VVNQRAFSRRSNHSAHEFARGDVTTNGIESFNALLKRGILGVYHHVTPKHLPHNVEPSAWAKRRVALDGGGES
jgi:hypothetical protein